MKPNEDYEIGQEDVIGQLGLLILDGRKHPDVKSSIKDCVNCDDGLIYHRKEDFVSFWQSCDFLMYIEVWLYNQEQFNVKKAMNRHSGYLLIEQWEIEIKINRISEHGYHCTEKMLMQAIKSKLHFSQLSAWLSLTDGKFPRHVYFRLCQRKDRTGLERFIRAPDFHQFPQINISTTKELLVSIYSLPHSDLPSDYPLFSWALADLPSPGETPQRSKDGEKAPGDFEEHSVLKNECAYKINQGRDYTSNHVHAVRKLEFAHFSLAVKNTSEKQQCLEKDIQTSENVNRTSTECSTKQQFQSAKNPKAKKYSAKENQSFMADKKELNTWSEMSNQEKNTPSESKTYFDVSNGCCKEITSCMSEQIGDRGEIMQRLGKDDMSLSSRLKHSNRFASRRTLEPQKESVSMEKPCFGNTLDSENFRSNSECRKQDISKKSLLARNIGAGSSEHAALNADVFECSQKEKKSCSKIYDACCNDRKLDSLKRQRSNSECSNEKVFYNLKSSQTISAKESKFKTEDSKDRQKSESESLKNKCLDHTIRKSWSVDKYGNVLHRAKMGNILPDVRHVMDKEYEKTLNERLRKCCLSNEESFEQEECKKKPEKARKRENNVFSDKKCAAIPSRNSRYHFRHASTGTLAVFHPSTGLPVSSSPAPFRKTAQKQTVDDICSPSCEPCSLSNQCGNLSKSAPTLTTQSLLVNFEESVLNDRLLPDGVVEGFTAELGASGSKKCLAHVTLPVQAYFFKLSDDNAPSPYMGYISLDVPGLRKKGYHVPKKGTIQLTLFNPNQTVVKVFVVLYDFSDMPPNFQTFLRQKTTSLVKSDGLVDGIHDNLHYLIHLRFTSSKSGRIYLHTDIRVIFARHPPDQGDLRTSTSGPTNPKYAPRHDVPGEF